LQKIKLYIWLLVVAALLSAGGLGVVLFLLRPDSLLNLALFYVLVAFLGFFVFMLLGIYIRRLFGQRELYNQYFAVAGRQAVWLSLVLTGSLALASQGLFSWTNAGFLVGAVIFFEFFLASRRSGPLA
jgi:hypothetical protein